MSAHDSISSRATSLETPDAVEPAPSAPSAAANGAAGDPAVTPDRGPVTLAAAVRRHPVLTVVPAIVLLAVGIVVGVKQPPTYSATATINVGKSDINTQATPGYVQASTVLASTYSRLVISQHISVPAARAVHQSAAAVGANLTAVPIPTQPTFTITATGHSPQAAVKLTNAAVSALQGFVDRSATQQGGTTQLLAKYDRVHPCRSAAADQPHPSAHACAPAGRPHPDSADSDTSHPGTGDPGTGHTGTSRRRGRLPPGGGIGQPDLSLAQNGSAPTLDVLISPTATTASNRTSNIEKYAVIGAVGGLIIGIALAALVSNVRVRPRIRRE